jgi:zinc D-Ala-D-Ala carboxypeptidase
MSLPSNSLLSAHFTAGELRADAPGIPAGAVANLKRVADYLEVVREVLGNKPIRVTSGWRSDTYNEQVNGSPTSSHLDGLAADIVPLNSASMYDNYLALAGAGLPVFDQIIFYPVQGHIHVGLGPANRREFRIKLAEGSGGTPLVSDSNAGRLPGASGSGNAAVNVVGVFESDTFSMALFALVAIAALAYAYS